MARNTRKGRSHRKALSRPSLNVEASQIPVELCAGNGYCPSRGIESPSAPTSRAAPSSSCCRWHPLLMLFYNIQGPRGTCVAIMSGCGVVEIRIESSCRVRNYFGAARAAAC